MSTDILPNWITQGCTTPYPAILRAIVSLLISVLVVHIVFSYLPDILPVSITKLLKLGVIIGAVSQLFPHSETWHLAIPQCKWKDMYDRMRLNKDTSHGEALVDMDREYENHQLRQQLNHSRSRY